MNRIDTTYRTQSLEKWEMEGLSEKNKLEKPTIKSIFSTFSFLIILVVVLPYLPPLKTRCEYNPPSNFTEYFRDVSFAAILLFSILFLTFGFAILRNKIDEKRKVKKVGTFEIKRMLNFGRSAFVGMNDLNFLIIKSSFAGLKYAKVGQIISVKKTATNKVISIYFRDKTKFETE